jgi:hypothetical protein
MRAQYKSKSNSENKESSNARALTTISCEKSSHPTDWHGLSMFPNITRPGTGHEKAKSHIRRTDMDWVCFPNITRPGTGHENARTSCNVKNRHSIDRSQPASDKWALCPELVKDTESIHAMSVTVKKQCICCQDLRLKGNHMWHIYETCAFHGILSC